MTDREVLPADFADLTPFIAEWGHLDSQDQRYGRRQELAMDRLLAYYVAVAPRLEAIFAHLDRFPHAAPLPPPEAMLLRVVMAMSEVAQAVELFKTPSVPGVPANHSVTITGLDRG